jgi:hypothetical protein
VLHPAQTAVDQEVDLRDVCVREMRPRDPVDSQGEHFLAVERRGDPERSLRRGQGGERRRESAARDGAAAADH